MTYKGRYKVKNRNKYEGNPDSVIYRSGWELSCFAWCDKNKDIRSWSSEEIVIPYLYEVDKKIHRYFVDLKIVYESGKTVIIEIKPEKQTVPPKGSKRTKQYLSEAITYVKNINKWKAAEEFAADRGWHFEIWTEKELRSLGILPKQFKPLKPMKKLKPFKRKSRGTTST